MLGKEVKIDFEGNKFKGIVTSISLGRSNTGGSELIIKGSSPTASLDEGAYTRSFYEKTLKEIVSNATQDYSGSALDNKPKFSKKLKYIVQYREGNFKFLTRLAARFGEWLFYDGEKLYFGAKPSGGSTIELDFGRDLRSMDLSVKAVPVNLELQAYDYKKHKFIKKTAEYGQLNEYAQIVYDKSKSEIYPGQPQAPYLQYMSQEDLDQLTEVWQKSHVSEMVFLHCSTEVQTLKLGATVHVVDQRDGLLGGTDDYGKFIITQISHNLSIHGDRYDYSNHFEAIPEESEVPPIASSIHPPFCEMQLADVTENNDPDGLGRIRVQFLWQRESGEKSPWIRVASPYSGKDKGFYIIPEAGDQVLVAFENNNSERPYVLTGMYNSDAKPEHHNSENHKKALKTAGGHEILMNDEKGKEAFGITSPKDVSVTATGGKMTITANAEVTVTSDSGDIKIDTPATITIHASKIVLQADAEISMEAPQIKITADAQFNAKAPIIAIEADGTNTLKGTGMVNVESSGITSIAGSIIKLN